MARGQPFSVSVAGGSLAGLSDPDRPWPLDIQARLADAVATLRGGIVDPLGARSVDVGIALRAGKLDALEELLVTTLPPMGAFDLKVRLQASAAGARLSDMEGAIGRTKFRGDVALDLLSSPPRLSGNVDIATLDLEPFLTDDLPPSESPAEVSLDDAFLSLQGLHDIDAGITLTVDRVLGLPMDIRDASVSPVIEGGRLAAQISATISEVPVEGMLAIESAPDALGFDIALASEGSDIDNLRTARKHAESVNGSFEGFTLRASGRGHNLRTALEDLDVRVLLDRADLSYGHEDREEPIPLILEAFELALPRGQALRLATTGTLLTASTAAGAWMTL